MEVNDVLANKDFAKLLVRDIGNGTTDSIELYKILRDKPAHQLTNLMKDWKNGNLHD